jgi:hypothetical protein
MILKKSPGGSIFPYYFKNGELFGLHLGSFGADEEGAIDRMKAEEKFLLEQNTRLGLWIDLYQTKLSKRLIAEVIDSLHRIERLVPKLALVGCNWIDQHRIDRYTRNRMTIPLRYFSDPEKAKSWLVTENK